MVSPFEAVVVVGEQTGGGVYLTITRPEPPAPPPATPLSPPPPPPVLAVAFPFTLVL